MSETSTVIVVFKPCLICFLTWFSMMCVYHRLLNIMEGKYYLQGSIENDGNIRGNDNIQDVL